ncbi:AAA family ATPase [Streptomyces sp. CC77]|uniref:AAA family ATPase n=1 Tax=Streptomyces sp. CC77 TaxID=1906739 RepID=UPI0008DCEE71|nr:SMC family ATPase [Streptomyces sp. CC77]OII67548.1 ATP-binding cassette family protein [Streptomyces sp. CC77]
MRLHRLQVTAFGPFGARQDIDFDALSTAGLFLLHGATGAGKTSILDAVCFALYGSVPGARQSPAAPLRSDHAPVGTPTEVVLELTVSGRRLRLTRRPAQPRPKRRGGGFTTEKAQSLLEAHDPGTDTWKGLSRSHQEIGEEIGQLLGMNREQFCQVVLLPQGDFSRFLRADAEARGRLLGRLFDTRRFAAVEERLAEQRRAAAQQVEAGDRQLLAIAHRMAQAAGGAADGWPAPEGTPGDPGLAVAVLTWAAVARSGAREARDAAELALSAAESRQAAAHRALEDEQERAARRQRHEDALRRAAALDARRGERDMWQARLEESRRAERIGEPLALRDEAERAHRAADTARTRAAAALPGEPADAGADWLAARDRALQQELAAVEAARVAEQRRAEIVRERAELDRRARADEEVLRDADAWLTGWEARRRELQEQAEAAQDAATRAELLAGRLEPARRRLAAARRRDALAEDVTAAEERLATAREAANRTHETWLDLRERRLRGIAAELAAKLADGAPCAVCGSPTHPAPAAAADGHVDRAAEDAAYEQHTRADAARADAERRLAVLRETHGAAAAEAAGESPERAAPEPAGAAPTGSGPVPTGPTVAELAHHVDVLETEHAETRALASTGHALREELRRAEHEHGLRLDARQQAGVALAAATSRREALDRQQAVLDTDLARALGTAATTVAERSAELERQIDAVARAADAVRAVEETARRLKEADDRLADAAYRAGFATPDAAAAALLDDGRQRDLQHRLDAWQAESAAIADRLAEHAARPAAEGPRPDPEAARAAYETAERAARAAASAVAAARDRCTALDRLSAQAEREVRRLGPLRDHYDRLARLATLTAGTSAENQRRMRLETYVLAARLEQVAAAATARLQRMSAGRYTLVHSDARAGTKRSGLGLHVVDAWTGTERDTATLSGGETFFVSLALALGLADVVTDEAGGVRLDTLFIDEGFGSLDEQTLDEVLDVLDGLRERDRSVGIVSHVPDLRRRIPAQLEVVKGRDGSRVRLRGAEVTG